MFTSVLGAAAWSSLSMGLGRSFVPNEAEPIAAHNACRVRRLGEVRHSPTGNGRIRRFKRRPSIGPEKPVVIHDLWRHALLCNDNRGIRHTAPQQQDDPIADERGRRVLWPTPSTKQGYDQNRDEGE